MAARVYITGAAGSGTSSLGRALAESLGVPHLDTDDFYWAPSDPPFTLKRPVPERLSLMAQAAGPDGGWVLSGSADSWGDGFIAGADLIVFLVTPTPVRLMRIRKREIAKFGDRVREGGDMHRNHGAFLTWAASYDDPYFGGRSLQRHRNWLEGQTTPVLELSGARPTAELAQECLSRLG
ncbi:adenylate kinase [Sedimentimonas flavescens]|uniref:ATP-binding protein n=1 Tax=Sedimentimonas flavescens TaxID=2851012 RepID=UPI001C4A2320|nr:adenylate kinase [Sedimentimonas flavescens]MBW0157790.1 adenylate kinase [Sedimentimonas flavescens]